MGIPQYKTIEDQERYLSEVKEEVPVGFVFVMWEVEHPLAAQGGLHEVWEAGGQQLAPSTAFI